MNPKELGDRYAELREERGIKSQAELGKLLNINVKTISFYENGQREMPTKTVIKYAEYFSVSAGWLLGIEDNPTTDIELRGVCEYTGLSEKAVNAIKCKSRAMSLPPNPTPSLARWSMQRQKAFDIFTDAVQNPLFFGAFEWMACALDDCDKVIKEWDKTKSFETSTEPLEGDVVGVTLRGEFAIDFYRDGAKGSLQRLVDAFIDDKIREAKELINQSLKGTASNG